MKTLISRHCFCWISLLHINLKQNCRTNSLRYCLAKWSLLFRLWEFAYRGLNLQLFWHTKWDDHWPFNILWHALVSALWQSRCNGKCCWTLYYDIHLAAPRHTFVHRLEELDSPHIYKHTEVQPTVRLYNDKITNYKYRASYHNWWKQPMISNITCKNHVG